MSPDEKPAPDATAPRGRGRPRVWSGPTERRRVHQERRRARERQVTALLHAVRNARWEEPYLQRLVQTGDELAILTALTEYYRRRHWQRWPGDPARKEPA